jgi:flagellar motor switch protein FliM
MSNTTLEEPKSQESPPAAPPAPAPATAVAAPAAPAVSDACPVVDYDWRAPRRFVAAERRKLADLAAKAAQCIATDVGGLLRRQLAFEAGPVTEHYAAALWNPAARPEYGVQLTDKAGRVCGMLGLPPQVAIGWVEQLLGGTSAAEGGLKALSFLESALLLDIAAAMVKAFSAASQELGGPALQHVESVALEQSPLQSRDGEEFCRFAFVTQTAHGRAEIGLAVFSDLLAAVADPALLKTKPRPPEELRKELMSHLAKTPVKVTAWIGRSTVTMRDVTVLEPGDVLLLSRAANDPIELLVMGNIVHMGRPVVCDGHYAVQVVERREWPRTNLFGKEKNQ